MDRKGVITLIRSRRGNSFIPLQAEGATTFSAWSGVCRMIPVPFLDDMLVRHARRRMVRGVAEKQGWSLEKRTIKALAHWEKRSFFARIGYLLRSLLVKPLKILFRTLFFWLAIRDAGRTMVETWLLGYTLRTMEEARVKPHAEQIGRAFGITIQSVDQHIASHFARKTWRKVRRREDPSIPGDRIQVDADAVSEVISEEDADFLAQFQTRFQAELERCLNPERVTQS